MTDKKNQPDEPGVRKPKAEPPGRELAAQAPTDGEPSGTAPQSSPPAPARKRDMVPVLYLAGFVILAGAIVWLYQNPPAAPPAPPSHELDALSQQVKTLQDRVARLEQRPAPPPPPPAPAPVDLAPLTARVAAVEARKPPPTVDLGPIEAAVAALQQRPVGDPALTARVEALAGRIDALANRVESVNTALTRQQDAAGARLTALEKEAGQFTTLTDRSAHLDRIRAAQAALSAGVKLGDVPGAPAAVSRYADTAPPTEASLRLSFPAAADAAMAASRPSVDGKPFLDRAWARAQALVTLRQGDHVIVGDPAAGILARAQTALDAGDLAGAVAALNALDAPAAAAVAGWKSQAQGLLDARKALADMAAHA